jgi:hypothetical protein
MKEKSAKDLLVSYISQQDKIFEEINPGIDVSGTPKKEINDPDKNAENPDLSDLMGSHNSILFLTSPDSSGIIKRGGNLGFLELTEDAIQKGAEIDLEDFQWWCDTDDFNKYLDKTGREYKKSTGEWTSENEEIDENKSQRNISSYSDFINEKEGSLNEFTGIPGFGGVGTNITSKGMDWEGDSPDFQGGKLSDSERKFVKFFFTRNHLKNSGIMQNQLNLNKLKIGDRIEIFVSAYDPKTGKSDDMSMVGVTFEVIAVISSQGDIASPMAVGQITHLSPNLGQGGGGGFGSILEEVVSNVYGMWDNLESSLSTSSGKIFATIISLGSIYGTGIFTTFAVMKALNTYRIGLRANALVSTGLYGKGAEAVAAATADIKSTSLMGRISKGIKNSGLVKFVKYPITILKRYKDLKKWNKTGFLGLKGWKAARYILFGKRAKALGKTATYASKLARAGSAAGKWSNPIGWVLLAADAIGSTLNYTSDNQAPSWDPIIGGEGDAMKDYKDNGTCPSASNSFRPSEIEIGRNITLCWTQNPESGFGLALSFVVSNSTRTTMNLTKIFDFKPKGQSQSLSLFLVNSVNYKELWNEIKGFDLRFLFIKDDTYEEGYADDNIGAYFLGAKSQPDSKDGILPISYYGHCDYAEFVEVYQGMPDQLVLVADDAPDEYNFHFEDSESNIINVYGRKITNKDIESASEEEIRSFFDVQPVSSLIGNPEDESEEERKERKSLESSARKSEEDLANSEGEEEDSENNESQKWYSSIETPKTITSFSDFKSIKESIIFEENGIPSNVVELPTESGAVSEKAVSSKQFQENFQTILQTADKPIPFAIYFVELREYANPELRKIYKPGSFMNFSIDAKAINSSDDSLIEGHVQISNLDVLIEPRKGIYTFSEKDKETEIKDTDIEKGEESKSGILSRSTERKEISSLPISKKEGKEISTTLDRMSSEDLSDLGISDWNDITSVKIIRDDAGNPKTVKLKNKKAKLGDKSRRFDEGDPNFQKALEVAKANKDKEEEENQKEESESDR